MKLSLAVEIEIKAHFQPGGIETKNSYATALRNHLEATRKNSKQPDPRFDGSIPSEYQLEHSLAKRNSKK